MKPRRRRLQLKVAPTGPSSCEYFLFLCIIGGYAFCCYLTSHLNHFVKLPLSMQLLFCLSVDHVTLFSFLMFALVE